MHAEIKFNPRKGVKQPWRWNFVQTNGKIVGNNETFPSKSNALRAVKAVVRGVRSAWPGTETYFTAVPSKDGKRTVIRWS